ncbi:MAG: hypothetical protein J6T88_03390 [Bacteroidales bacterium]|nr:hypothetical protein [Bacteroidales bacterium]
MKQIVKALTKLAMFCMIALPFYPSGSIAQTTKPRNGEIYFYQHIEKTGDESQIEWIAIQFVDEGIKTMSHSHNTYFGGPSFDEFKADVIKNISKKVIIKLSTKDSKGGKTIYKRVDESIDGSFTYEFSQSYSSLKYTYSYYNEFDDYYDHGSDIYDIIK